MKRAIGFICLFSILIVIVFFLYDRSQSYTRGVCMVDVINAIIFLAVPAGVGLHIWLKKRTERIRASAMLMEKTEIKSLKDQF